MHIFLFQFYYCTVAILITQTQAATSTASTSAVHVTQAVTPAVTPAVTKPPPLEFTCATDGTIIEIKGVNETDVVILNGTSYCHLNEKGCDLKNKKKVNVLHVQGEKSPIIAGGKNAHFYQLECKTAGSFVASVNASIHIANPATNVYNKETRKPTEPTTLISLDITDKNGHSPKEVHIGDPLLLQITGPGLYTVEPIKCTANSASSPNTDYVLWTNDTCSSKDEAVIEGAWKQDNSSHNKITIQMYGFRFVDSDTVKVKCTALFCPIGVTCSSKTCVTGQGIINGRKKRDAGVETKSENGYIQKHISTSFRVTDNRMDTSACSGIYRRFSTLRLYPHIICNERKYKIPVTSSTRNHETCK
ncbi:unnamed protein product [Mytilus coruscus]|uniref:Ig-like domain-containing protein n=1 Tax=Mytilus coruscus TaxID=42192 RepID=A0A6J8AM73_MYTCO|nr:unnamed protein product [Mytilus coruscus]